MALTPKQERFCQEYMTDLNATQAAIRSGYSADSAASIGHENLTKPEIQARIRDLHRETEHVAKVTEAYVTDRLKIVVERYLTYKPAMALKALDLLGRTLGMFTPHEAIANELIRLAKETGFERGDAIDALRWIVQKHDENRKSTGVEETAA